MGGCGSSRAPWMSLFLCSEMNFRQISFSETELLLIDGLGYSEA